MSQLNTKICHCRAILFSQSLSISLHTLLEHCCVHNQMPSSTRTKEQHLMISIDYQIKLNSSQPRVVGSSWRSFPVRRGLLDCSNNYTVIIFIRRTVGNVSKKSQAVLYHHDGQRETPRHCPNFKI